MREIGGFFELETTEGIEFHSGAIKLNSARNAILYILKAKNVKRLFLPLYVCGVVVQKAKEAGADIVFYNIDNNFKPVFSEPPQKDDFILYVNYFGINSENVKNLKQDYKNIIIDNSQAFFEDPLRDTNTVYSARKFFGVPDGGYLYTDSMPDNNIEISYSYERCRHLLKRADLSAQEAYQDYQRAEESLINETIMQMSSLTRKILAGVDYQDALNRRNENFLYIHRHLGGINKLNINTHGINGPMVYPLLIEKDGLRQHLIDNKIYIARYWAEVLDSAENGSTEEYLTKYLLPLPIDQRYKEADMERVINCITSIL